MRTEELRTLLEAMAIVREQRARMDADLFRDLKGIRRRRAEARLAEFELP